MGEVKDPKNANDQPPFNPLKAAQPLRERVYEALEEMIVDGVLVPGWHLREGDLADRLGVSRNPVREALQWLVHDGFVEHQPGKGAFIHVPSMEEVEEIFHTRMVLESETAFLAAERITASDVSRLEGLMGEGQKAVETQNVGELLKLNEAFHNVVIDAANNTVMAKMMRTLRRRIRWYFSSVVAARSADSWTEHGEILEALRNGDGNAACQRMAAHVRHTSQTIQKRQSADDDEIAASRLRRRSNPAARSTSGETTP